MDGRRYERCGLRGTRCLSAVTGHCRVLTRVLWSTCFSVTGMMSRGSYLCMVEIVVLCFGSFPNQQSSRSPTKNQISSFSVPCCRCNIYI